jgi:hypothetical protein
VVHPIGKEGVMTAQVKNQPKITVGIMDRQTEVFGRLDGNFNGDGFGPVSGWFSAKADAGMIVLTDEAHREITRSPSIRLTAFKDSIRSAAPLPKRRERRFQDMPGIN